MPDADRLDRALHEAGERWRAGQPAPPPVAAVWSVPASRSGIRAAGLLVVAGLAVLLGISALSIGGSPRPSTAVLPPNASPTVPTGCPATLRSDEPGPLASQTANLSLPGSLVPYGQPALWATIPRSGSLGSSTSTTGGRFIRTFWYSDRWSMTDEPSPRISVSAGRLGGGDSVTGSAAVGAHSRDLGDSMIVSLDLPSGGCWQITASYRDQSLSYVVLVEPQASGPIVSTATDLPGDIDGVPVTPVAEAPSVLAATKPGMSILVGGFLTPDVAKSCPMMRTFPDLWNVCLAIRLSPGPWGGEFQAVYKGSTNVALPTIPDGQVEPVVLRVHSNDPGCPPSNDCASLPVLDAVVWLGRVGPIPSPSSTQPPNGISEATAKALALVAAGSLSPSKYPRAFVVSARLGHYAEVGPPGSVDVDGDRWVWAVVLRGFFAELDCAANVVPCNDTGTTRLVVLDYITGEVLIQETPAPSS